MSFLDAATRADENAVAAAIHAGADVNTLDAAGRSALVCAIGGDSWETADASNTSFRLEARRSIVRTLIRDQDLSLYVANAPYNGVTPLGLAAWLDLHDVVRVLSEEGQGIVAIDGMDTHGATPLMYAARDGRLEVVFILLRNGARPDFRDVNHRTSIQHALRHPRVLCLCESALRRQRIREYMGKNRRRLTSFQEEYRNCLQHSASSDIFDITSIPQLSRKEISRVTASLVDAILSSDIAALHSLLFSSSAVARPSALVNFPDQEGWSPIHYCAAAEHPSIEVLDALYLAGADMSLFSTSGHGTALHCLARAGDTAYGTPPASLRSFIHHLVRDLRAPLSAQDDRQETCLHIAAEHGHSIDVVTAFLDCDTKGTVRQMRNARGLTPLEVCKPEFRAAFGMFVESSRSESSASARTIKPSTASSSSLKSMASMTSTIFDFRSPLERKAHSHDCADISLSDSGLPSRILDNLRQVSYELESENPGQDSDMRQLFEETSCMGEELFSSLRSRIHDIAEDLRDARGMFKRVDNFLERVTTVVEDRLGEPMTEESRGRDSGDSESTAVSERDSSLSLWKQNENDLAPLSVPVIVEPPVAEVYVNAANDGLPSTDAGLLHPSPDSVQEEGRLMKLISPWIKDLPRRKSKGDLRSGVTDTSKLAASLSSELDKKDLGTTKLKTWFLKKLRPDALHPGPDVQEAVPAPGIPILVSGKPHANGKPIQGPDSRSAQNAMCATARRVISSASKDLSRIDDCMDTAEQFISLASHSITQAERRLSTSILNHMACLPAPQPKFELEIEEVSYPQSNPPYSSTQNDSIEFPSGDVSPYQRSFSDPKPAVSPDSSIISFSSTLLDGDDEDIRAIRRLLTRKIEARMDGAIEEIDKVMTWLPIVRDIIRNLDRRTRSQSH